MVNDFTKRTTVPKIRFLKCPNKMSEQAQKCSDIMEFWSDIENFIILLLTLCPHKLMFGQSTGRKLSDCNFRLNSGA